MHHPIHIHGLRFLVLDQDGKVNNNMGWKDTILVRTGSTVDILLQAIQDYGICIATLQNI